MGFRDDDADDVDVDVGVNNNNDDDDDHDDDDDDNDIDDDDDDDDDGDDDDEISTTEGVNSRHPSAQMDNTKNLKKHWPCAVKTHFPGQHTLPGRKYMNIDTFQFSDTHIIVTQVYNKCVIHRYI